VGTRCANHVTPLYQQNLALTSPTGGGRSVGMVRSRTKATEFSLVYERNIANNFTKIHHGSAYITSNIQRGDNQLLSACSRITNV